MPCGTQPQHGLVSEATVSTDSEHEALHQNRQSFVFKKTVKGHIASACRLNKAAFVTIKTPKWEPWMSPEEAREAWGTYVKSFQPRSYPRV